MIDFNDKKSLSQKIEEMEKKISEMRKTTELMEERLLAVKRMLESIDE